MYIAQIGVQISEAWPFSIAGAGQNVINKTALLHNTMYHLPRIHKSKETYK